MISIFAFVTRIDQLQLLFDYTILFQKIQRLYENKILY